MTSTLSATVDECREAFERWAMANGQPVSSMTGKGYTSKRTTYCWHAWKETWSMRHEPPKATSVGSGIASMHLGGWSLPNEAIDVPQLTVTDNGVQGQSLRIALNSIAAQIERWLEWDKEGRSAEGLKTDDDTHLMVLPVPFWPTHGMFRNWISALQAAIATMGDASNRKDEEEAGQTSPTSASGISASIVNRAATDQPVESRTISNDEAVVLISIVQRAWLDAIDQNTHPARAVYKALEKRLSVAATKRENVGLIWAFRPGRAELAAVVTDEARKAHYLENARLLHPGATIHYEEARLNHIYAGDCLTVLNANRNDVEGGKAER